MKFIQQTDHLQEAVADMEKAAWLAVDTEADSLHHYYEKLCLIQISTTNEDYVFDPLSLMDLSPVMELLAQKPLICQGADFDLRMLKKFYDVECKQVFDTMIAAQFLSYPRPSLAALVEHHFQVKLPKTNQKADWSKRPLTDSMLEYAANDTHFLPMLKDILTKELEEAERYAWFEEECRMVIAELDREPRRAKDDPWRVKGWKELVPRELVMLKMLWEWREDEGQRRDRPCFKVMSSEQMAALAKWIVEHKGQEIELSPKFPKSYHEKNGPILNKAIAAAWETPESSIAFVRKGEPGKRFSPREKELVGLLKQTRNTLAQELKIESSLLASNALIENIVKAKPRTREDFKKVPEILKWQSEVLAEPFLETLHPAPKK